MFTGVATTYIMFYIVYHISHLSSSQYHRRYKEGVQSPSHVANKAVGQHFHGDDMSEVQCVEGGICGQKAILLYVASQPTEIFLYLRLQMNFGSIW